MIALIVALGGVGYTAVKLPRNSVGLDQLRKSAVTESKLARGAVTSLKIKDKSVTGDDIDPAALAKVPTSATADRAKVADAVAGQQIANVAATVPFGGFARVIGGDGGLEVFATCSISGSLLLSAKSASENAQLRASVVSAQSMTRTSPRRGGDGLRRRRARDHDDRLSRGRRSRHDRGPRLRRADRNADLHGRRDAHAHLNDGRRVCAHRAVHSTAEVPSRPWKYPCRTGRHFVFPCDRDRLSPDRYAQLRLIAWPATS